MKFLITFVLIQLLSFSALASITGVFERVVRDDYFVGEQVEYYIVDSRSNSRIRLIVNDESLVENIYTGDVIDIETGLLHGPDLIELAIVNSVSAAEPIEAGAGYDKTVLMVIVNYNDLNAFTDSVGATQRILGVKQNYIDTSYGKLRLNLDKDQNGALDIVTVQMGVNGVGIGCGSGIREPVKQKLAEMGIPYKGYNHVVMYFPNAYYLGAGSTDCPSYLQGKADIGSIGNNNNLYVSIFAELDTPNYKTTEHEIGHNLGWAHAGVDRSGDGTILSADQYKDRSSFMGEGGTRGHAVHSYYHNFFEGEDGAVVTMLDASQVFTIAPLDINPWETPHAQLVKVYIGQDSKNRSEYFYLSVRRPQQGDDINLPIEHIGLQITRAHGKGECYCWTGYVTGLKYGGDKYYNQATRIDFRVLDVDAAGNFRVSIRKLSEIDPDENPQGPVEDYDDGK